MRWAAKKICRQLIRNEIVLPADAKIYEYGLEMGLAFVINFLLFWIVGTALDMLVCSMLFLAAFAPLRFYVGGYHAKSHTGCFALTLLVLLLALQLVRCSFTGIYAVLACMGIPALLWLSPVENRNKPLEQEEKRVYRKRAYIVIAVQATLIFGFILADLAVYAMCIEVAVILTAASALAGYAQNKKQNSAIKAKNKCSLFKSKANKPHNQSINS